MKYVYFFSLVAPRGYDDIHPVYFSDLLYLEEPWNWTMGDFASLKAKLLEVARKGGFICNPDAVQVLAFNRV